MKKVFISYRRADSKHITGRIYDRLIKVYKRKNIFKDVDSIPHGLDYRIVIENAVKSSDIILAIIGTNWASITDEDNNIRIHNKNDFVRLEIELGLENNIPIIPVLVDNATLPNKKEFSASILPLYYKNAIKVRHDPDFNNDIKKLIDSMIQIAEPKRSFNKFIRSLTHISKTMRYVLLGVVLGIFIMLYTFNLNNNTLNKNVTIAVDYNDTKVNKNHSVIPGKDGDIINKTTFKNGEEVIVKTVTHSKLEFVEERPPWCYTNKESIKDFKIDEYFICMNKDIWEYENRYVYKFKTIHRKLDSDNREKLILFKNNWLKYRKITCVSSVKLCIDSHKNILNELINIFDK